MVDGKYLMNFLILNVKLKIIIIMKHINYGLLYFLIVIFYSSTIEIF